MTPDDNLGICHDVRKLREGALPYWQPLWTARMEERDFLDGDRYADEDDVYNKDRRRVQFRGQEISNVNRHKAAQATATPRSIEALPVDQNTDADDSEIAVSVLEWELSHPQKGFDDVLDEVVQDAVDCRAGAAILDYDPELGKWGETYWRYKDMNLLMWEPGFSDPHHLKCGWLQEVRRMHMDELQAMKKLKGKAKWYVPDSLMADGQMTSFNQGAGYPDISPLRRSGTSGSLLGVPDPPVDDEHVWVLFCWYKNDTSTYKKESDNSVIPDGQRYFACMACGYRSPTQDELIQTETVPGDFELPESEQCPQCGQLAERMDVRTKEEDVLAYPKGRRLVIMPLLQQLPDDEPFYDGGWPVPTARSFPLLYITAYVKPGRPMGDSDTTRNWDAQLASDQLMTMAFDRIMRHQNYYVLPRKGVYDVSGNRFEYRDDQFNVMYVDQSDVNIATMMPTMVDGSALDPAWTGYWSAVQNKLLSHQGITDLGLTPDSSKAIAASTVAQLNQMGEIPVEHFKRRKNRALGKAYGVHWDYIRYTYPAERLARLQIEDEFVIDRLRGDDLPNFDFRVAESPEFTGLEKARSEAFTALQGAILQAMQTGSDPNVAVDLFVEINKLPPSIGRKAKKMIPAPPPIPGLPPAMGGGAPPPELPADLSPMLAQMMGPAAAQPSQMQAA